MASVDFMVELPRGDLSGSGFFGRNLVSKIVNVDFFEIVLWPFPRGVVVGRECVRTHTNARTEGRERSVTL